MQNSLYMYIKYIKFSLAGFYGISTIVGYSMLNPLYTHILDIYDLVYLGFMTYQPLLVIYCEILFIHHIYIYIYIHSHPQTDCFVLSELFSVVRHAGRWKPESKTRPTLR